jgi:hypothetical protein
MDNRTAYGSDILEVEQFLRTPDAYRVLNRDIIAQKEGRQRQSRETAPTYDRVIEAVLAGDEPLEVVTRPLGALGQGWMVTLKNLPHLAVFVSTNKSECETVALSRRLAQCD